MRAMNEKKMKEIKTEKCVNDAGRVQWLVMCVKMCIGDEP